jgi:hypothetical protein
MIKRERERERDKDRELVSMIQSRIKNKIGRIYTRRHDGLLVFTV